MSRRDDQYDHTGRYYDKAEAKRVYDATPPARFADVFWTAVAAQMGRSMGGVRAAMNKRWGWPPKLLPPAPKYTCRDCKVALKGPAERCRKCDNLRRKAPTPETWCNNCTCHKCAVMRAKVK